MTESKPVIKKWSKAEEHELLDKGSVQGRSEGACAIRRKLIAHRLVEAGDAPEVAAKACGVSVNDIEEQAKIEANKKLKASAKGGGAVQTVNSTPSKDIDLLIEQLKALKKRVNS